MNHTHTTRSRVTGLTTRHYADGTQVITSGNNPWATVQRTSGPAWVVEAATQTAAVERAVREVK